MIAVDVLIIVTVFSTITFVPLILGRLLGNLSIYMYNQEINKRKEVY